MSVPFNVFGLVAVQNMLVEMALGHSSVLRFTKIERLK